MDAKKTISLKDMFRMLPVRYEDVDNIDPNSKDRRGFRGTIGRQALEKLEKIGFIETGLPHSDILKQDYKIPFFDVIQIIDSSVSLDEEHDIVQGMLHKFPLF